MADLGISIHAPTWGATLKPLHQAAGISYFNPRTHVGCDISFHSAHLTAFYFNPRTHVGCDLNRLVQRVAVGEISIHAPTWGATQRHQPRLSGAVYFNPRTHVGCDGVNTGIAVWDSEFQSTHPRGVRHGQAAWKLYSRNFNPRTHVGCDCIASWATWDKSNFNPRTHVGCDAQEGGFAQMVYNFNPRTHVGCDPQYFYVQRFIYNFNPRTHVGCDIYRP